jgi:hypothetical protein
MRLVDYAPDTGDYLAVLMAEFGFSTKAIARQTRLTVSQVNYRVRGAGVKRSDYRDGTSRVADKVWDARYPILGSGMMSSLSAYYDRQHRRALDAKRVKKAVASPAKSAKRTDALRAETQTHLSVSRRTKKQRRVAPVPKNRGR